MQGDARQQERSAQQSALTNAAEELPPRNAADELLARHDEVARRVKGKYRR